MRNSPAVHDLTVKIMEEREELLYYQEEYWALSNEEERKTMRSNYRASLRRLRNYELLRDVMRLSRTNAELMRNSKKLFSTMRKYR